MTDEERLRVDKIWNAMSVAERQEVDAELHAIYRWWNEAEDKAMEQLKAEERHQGGIDGHYPELMEISKEARSKINELALRVFGVAWSEGVD